MTAADWTAQNPVLPQFQIGIEVNAATGAYGRMKIGDGQTAWNDLNYLDAGGVKVYRALLTQTGTDAPVATVLENTLGGEVVWSYTNVGDYLATLSGAFTANKTFVLLTNGKLTAGQGGLTTVAAAHVDGNSIAMSVSDANGDFGDDVLQMASIEIRVYPS